MSSSSTKESLPWFPFALGAAAATVGIAALSYMRRYRQYDDSPCAAAASLLQKPGMPKVHVVESVASANDLLIKQIARETGELIASLPKDRCVVNMSQGVPCMKIFEESYREMSALLDTRLLPYSDVPGTLDVRTACADFVNLMYAKAGQYTPAFNFRNVTITSGAIQAIYCSLAMSVECAEDVVATTLPAYGLYKQQTHMLKGTFAAIPTTKENSFVPTTNEIRALFSVYTGRNDGKAIKALVLCFPNNPTGSMLTETQARDLCAVLEALLLEGHKFTVILDEVYLGITSKPYVSLLQYASDFLRPHMLLVLSASKGLGAMPGARAAWVTSAAPLVIEQLGKVQLVTSGNCSTISQQGLKGALSFLTRDRRQCQMVSDYYGERAELVASLLNSIGAKNNIGDLCKSGRPEGTFYVWANFKAISSNLAAKGITTDIAFTTFLKEMYKDDELKTGVAVVPGSAFLMDSSDLFIRFSCARDDIKEIEKAMAVVDKAVRLIIE